MPIIFWGIISLFLLSCGYGHKSHKHHQHGPHKKPHHKYKHEHGHHRFDDAKKWAGIFEDKKRDQWQKPEVVLKALALKPTDRVADIGAATGYFPVRLAKQVQRGRVWAVDIEPNLVRYLNERAEKEKIGNLYSILGAMDDPLIPEKVDVILIVNTYHHIGKRERYFKNLKKYLRTGGRLAIVDFRMGDLPVGPKDPMKLSKATVISEMKKAGYQLQRDVPGLPYQYLLTFTSQ